MLPWPESECVSMCKKKELLAVGRWSKNSKALSMFSIQGAYYKCKTSIEKTIKIWTYTENTVHEKTSLQTSSNEGNVTIVLPTQAAWPWRMMRSRPARKGATAVPGALRGRTGRKLAIHPGNQSFSRRYAVTAKWLMEGHGWIMC